MAPELTYYDLELVKPDFGSTHPKILFQLKRIFHTLESIGTARIEGDNTTITDFIENKPQSEDSVDEKILGIHRDQEQEFSLTKK